MRECLVAALIALLVAGAGLASQRDDTVDAIENVLDWIDDDFLLVPENGQWGLVFGLFAEGEEKEIRFNVTSGETYRVAGGGDNDAEDLDICVYDQFGSQIGCDTLVDNIPLVEFTAQSSGTFRAVLTAYELTAGSAYAGMAILRQLD